MSVYITDWTEFDLYSYTRVSDDKYKNDAKQRLQAKSTGEQFECQDAWRRSVGAPDWKGRYSDEDISASRAARKQKGRKVKDREDWKRLMGDLEQPTGRRKVLCVWEVSRGTRDRPVWASLMELCQDEEILICVDGTVYDPNDPDDETWLDFQFMMANRESRIIQKRTRRSSAASIAKGEPHGRCPLGYRRTYDPFTGNFQAQVPDPETVPIVRQIFTWAAAGRTCYWIARKLQADGVPTYAARQKLARDPDADVSRCHWTTAVIGDMIDNVSYIGRRRHDRQDTGNGTWEGIVPEDLFWAARRACAERKFTRGKASSRGWLLSSVPECGVCQAKLVVRRNPLPARYTCRWAGHASVAMAELDELVTDVVLERLSSEYEQLEDTDDAAVVAAQAKLDAAQTEMADLVKLVDAGQISPRLAASSEQAIQRKIDAAQVEADAARMPLAVRQIAGPRAKAIWQEWDNDQRRDLIRRMARIVVWPSGKGKGIYVPARERVEVVEWLC